MQNSIFYYVLCSILPNITWATWGWCRPAAWPANSSLFPPCSLETGPSSLCSNQACYWRNATGNGPRINCPCPAYEFWSQEGYNRCSTRNEQTWIQENVSKGSNALHGSSEGHVLIIQVICSLRAEESRYFCWTVHLPCIWSHSVHAYPAIFTKRCSDEDCLSVFMETFDLEEQFVTATRKS